MYFLKEEEIESYMLTGRLKKEAEFFKGNLKCEFIFPTEKELTEARMVASEVFVANKGMKSIAAKEEFIESYVLDKFTTIKYKEEIVSFEKVGEVVANVIKNYRNKIEEQIINSAFLTEDTKQATESIESEKKN